VKWILFGKSISQVQEERSNKMPSSWKKNAKKTVFGRKVVCGGGKAQSRAVGPAPSTHSKNVKNAKVKSQKRGVRHAPLLMTIWGGAGPSV
jgi:hypothetical protein